MSMKFGDWVCPECGLTNWAERNNCKNGTRCVDRGGPRPPTRIETNKSLCFDEIKTANDLNLPIYVVSGESCWDKSSGRAPKPPSKSVAHVHDSNAKAIAAASLKQYPNLKLNLNINPPTTNSSPPLLNQQQQHFNNFGNQQRQQQSYPQTYQQQYQEQYQQQQYQSPPPQQYQFQHQSPPLQQQQLRRKQSSPNQHQLISTNTNANNSNNGNINCSSPWTYAAVASSDNLQLPRRKSILNFNTLTGNFDNNYK